MACSACGLRYLDPQPAPDELETLYGEAYFARSRPGEPGYDRYLEEIDNIRRTFDDRLRFLPSQAAGSCLLDVGAAIGLFVERARRAGWNAEGVEPSQWAARYAHEVLGQPVRPTTLEAAQIAPQSVDVVTLWEVIEHLPDPRATLAAIRRVLRPGGLLVLSTPDAGSLVARALGKRWPGWGKIPEHLFFFDRRTLGTLLTEQGFVVKTMRYVSLVVSRGYLLDRVCGIAGIRPHARLSRAWLDRPVKVNPFYDLLIAARAPR
ncbi:MAG: class I SAM-dependent methyltransferase [Gemmatimonadales bacterium]|nr:class I SAM-dependent methyltransferase [Gemmatimonadales bacterium]